MNKKIIMATTLATSVLVVTVSAYASNSNVEYEKENWYDRFERMEKMMKNKSENFEFRWNAQRFLELDDERKSQLEALRNAKLEEDIETYEALKEELWMGQRNMNWEGFGKRMWRIKWQWNCNKTIN